MRALIGYIIIINLLNIKRIMTGKLPILLLLLFLVKYKVR